MLMEIARYAYQPWPALEQMEMHDIYRMHRALGRVLDEENRNAPK